MDAKLHPVSSKPPRNLQTVPARSLTPPPCSLHFLESYWLTFQERRGGRMPGSNWSSDKSLHGKSNLFTLKPKCLLTSLQPAGPGTGQTFTLSFIDRSRPLPLGTDHLFSGWYKWNWLEQGLIDLRAYASWHSRDDRAWRERRTFVWSLPGPPTERDVNVRARKRFPRKHICISLCLQKLQPSQKGGDKW